MHRLRNRGNVSALLDSADGSLDAKYEYGAFGEPLRVGGSSIAADNPFHFSTKYTDTDGARERVDGDAEGVARRAKEAGAPWALMRQSGLVYYGFRYYSPSLGRFLNRDPFGEEGGSNLYGFVENDPVNGGDYLGLDDELLCDPADYSAGLCDDGQNSDDEDIEELEPYEVVAKRPWWLGSSRYGYPKAPIDRSIGFDTNFPVRNPGDSLGPNGGGGGSGGGGGGGGCKEKKTKKEKKVPKKWLKKLCSTPAGRALVKRMAKGRFSLRAVNISKLSTGVAAAANETDGTIYMFGSNHSRIRSAVATKYGYRGSTVDFAISAIIHEVDHFSTSAPPTARPGQERRYEEAAVLENTDKQLPSYVLPPIFGFASSSDYLSIIPPGKNLSTGKSASDYGYTGNRNVMNELNTKSLLYGGWDCSRVGI